MQVDLKRKLRSERESYLFRSVAHFFTLFSYFT
ncbi:hypothetical protein ACVW0B_002262 [Thermostichus sp. MS-CIW-23]|jgi:hypothetical protein